MRRNCYLAVKEEKCTTSAQGDRHFRESGILLSEQSTPRHKDLKAGIRMRAVRRAIKSMSQFLCLATESYSPAIHRFRGVHILSREREGGAKQLFKRGVSLGEFSPTLAELFPRLPRGRSVPAG